MTAPSPHPAVSVAATAGVLAANSPSLLPHSMATAGALTAGCVAVLTIPTLLLTRDRTSTPLPARRTLVAAAAVSAGSVTANAMWQSGLQHSIHGHSPAVAAMMLWAVVVYAAAAITFAALVWAPRVSALGAAMTAAMILGLSAPAQAEPGVPRGDAPSVVERWHAQVPDSSGPVIVAVPTGSGWVDQGAIDGLHRRLGSDVPVLALPYDNRSSWKSFVDNRSAAGEAAIAVLRSILAASPADARPAVHLYGQSLGALGAEQARRWADRHAPGLVVETILVGPPGDTVGNADTGSPRSVVANHSDPVPIWSPALLWRPPAQPDDMYFIGTRTPEPPWIPVISFLQTSVDLLTALDGPAGAGHRYGSDQAMGPRAASYAAPTR